MEVHRLRGDWRGWRGEKGGSGQDGEGDGRGTGAAGKLSKTKAV